MILEQLLQLINCLHTTAECLSELYDLIEDIAGTLQEDE